MWHFAGEAAELIAKAASMEPEMARRLLTLPPDAALGDLAFPCFALARERRQSPGVVAAEIAGRIQPVLPFGRAEAAGPYVNLRLDRACAAQTLLNDVLKADARWGGSSVGIGQSVCIDYCSPNIARPMHLGHLRSTVIGESLARLHEALGYQVIRINFLGDWGTQFGKLIVGWKKWGDPEALANDPIAELVRVYVRFHQEARINPALEDDARAWFRRLESGEVEALDLWRWIREESLKRFEATLSLLGVKFDVNEGEAFYADKTPGIVRRLEEMNLLTESQGARVVELDGLPPCLVLKSDGATLYPTRDLAAAIYRHEKYAPARSIYVVGETQSLHFRQVFAVLARMGEPWANTLEHVGFGMMSVEGKKLHTREGDVVYLQDVLEQATEAAREAFESRSPGMEGLNDIARAVGVGAVIFNDLKNHRKQNVDFNADEALNFEGETGPYVQYAHARCRSMLRKAGGFSEESITVPAHTCYAEPAAWNLLTSIASFPHSIMEAAEACEPHLLARALLRVAKSFSTFYHESPVLKAEPDIRDARLALVKASALTLQAGLRLLGLEAPPMRAE